MKKPIKLLIPIVIILVTVIIVKMILDNPAKSKKSKEKQTKKVLVEIQKIKSKEFTPFIESYGLVEASTSTQLISQVSGKIVYINEKFKDGAFLKKGDLLISIEDTEYKADVKIAEAEYILAKQQLLEEQANADQAKEEWENLHSNLSPSDLVLRVPQLNAAKANLLASQAKLDKAKLVLKRTKIYVPYDSRVIKKNIDISQVINTNITIGEIYAINNIQIRLPIKNKDLDLLNIEEKPELKLSSSLSQNIYKATIQRSESRIDSNSKQLNVIAKIDFHKDIKIGEYLKAKIKGINLKNALYIPNSSIYQGSYIYIEKDGIVTRRDIKIRWQDEKKSLIDEGLKDGENIVLTRLGLISSGTAVEIINEKGQTK